MNDDALDLQFADARTLAAAVRARRVSALELTHGAIARIEALDTAINAVVVRDFDRACAAAKAADRALARGDEGALLGVPMTVKEAHHVAGLPTTWGNPLFRDWIAEADTIAVSRLRAAGAVILGKTNVPPSLSDWQTDNCIYGRTNNPFDLARTPGGSSGGSAAAIAAGLIPLELGSDLAGSLRVPAGFCGIFAHKASYGLVSTGGFGPPGVVAGSAMPMAVIGPMARTAADLRLALDVVAGADANDLPAPRHARLANYRVLLIDEHPNAVIDGEVRAAFHRLRDALEHVGVAVAQKSDLLPDLTETMQCFFKIVGAVKGRGGSQDEVVREQEAAALREARASIAARYAAMFSTFDVVLAPTYGTPAFLHDNNPNMMARTLTIDGRETPYVAQSAWSSMASVAHLPSTVAPIDWTSAGLPIGAQILGGYRQDRTTIEFAGLLEQELGGFRAPGVRHMTAGASGTP